MLLIPFSVASAIIQASNSPEVTIYNQGFGFIKELRTLNLKAGQQAVAIEDVAARIETNSVGIRNFSPEVPFEVLEQNYQFDLISREAILNKAVGQKIRFHRTLPNGQKEVIVGTLVSSPTAIVNGGRTYNGMILRTDDGRILLDPTGEIEVESIPDGLISKPTLMWELDAAKAGNANVEVSYLTQGMNWNADYVLTLDGKSNKAALRGWVTVNNQCGATFNNAKLKLLAGDVERARPQAPGGMMGGRGGAEAMMNKSAGFQEEGLFEYHLYTLGRPANIRNNEIKQLSLLESDKLQYEKKIVVDALLNFGMYYPSEGEIGVGDIKPQVRVEFLNKKEFGLGIPLPKGNMKVYQADASGSLQMLGEDAIDHTPKEEKISLVVGRSFDIRATRTRKNFRRLSDRAFEESFEIEIRNRKDVAEKVHLYERHYAEWKITQTNMEWTKPDSQTQVFVVPVGANETKTVKYTVITSW